MMSRSGQGPEGSNLEKVPDGLGLESGGSGWF
jgi:hypothetical protein